MAVVACALFDFVGERTDMLSFSEGDTITILKQEESGWWSGSDVEGRIGIFPYNYVKLKEDSKVVYRVAKALYDFETGDDNDLNFKEGEMVTVIQELSPEWYLGRSEDGERTGQFPSSYVQLTEEKNTALLEKEAKKVKEREEKAQKAAEAAAKERAAAEKKLKEEKQRAAQKLKEETEKAEREKEKAERKRLEKEAKEAKERAEKAERELEKARKKAEKQRAQEEDAKRRQSARFEADRARKEIEKMAIAAKTKFAGEDPAPPASEPDEEIPDVKRVSLKEEPKPNRREVKFKYKSKFANLGGGSKCKKCEKSVGFADKVKACGGEWHTGCFKCDKCGVVLRQGNFNDQGGTPFCRVCYGKLFGPKGFGFGGVAVGVDAGELRGEKRKSGTAIVDHGTPLTPAMKELLK